MNDLLNYIVFFVILLLAAWPLSGWSFGSTKGSPRRSIPLKR